MVNKPYIATPCYEKVTPAYAKSLAATAYKLGLAGVESFIGEPMHNFNVPLARNGYVERFLDTHYDPLVFIDSDMGWDPDQFLRLVISNHDIACATYRMKSDPLGQAQWVHTNIVQKKIAVNGADCWLPIVHPRTGFVKVLSSGTGMMAIRRRVFERMFEAMPERKAVQMGAAITPYLFEVACKDGVVYTEDTYFCKLWNDLQDCPVDCTCDRHVWCDPKGQLDHVGIYTWTGGLCDTISEVSVPPTEQEMAGAAR